MLEPAFSKDIAEAYRDGMKALWRASAPERPVRGPGSPTTVKWITIYAYAAIGLEAAESPRFAETLSDSEVSPRCSACLSIRTGIPGLARRNDGSTPKHSRTLGARCVLAEEWAAEESRGSYFLYHFAQNGTAIQSDLQKAIFDVIAKAKLKRIHTLDRGLDIIRNLTLSGEQREALRVMALARFGANKKCANPAWAARYVALLFLLDGPSAAATLIVNGYAVKSPASGKRSLLPSWAFSSVPTILWIAWVSSPGCRYRL